MQTENSHHEEHIERNFYWSKRESTVPRNALSDNNMGKFSILPKDVIVVIFSFLSPRDLLRSVAGVCWNWRKLSEDDIIWRQSCMEQENWTSVAQSGFNEKQIECWLCKFIELSFTLQWIYETKGPLSLELSNDQRTVMCVGGGWHTIQLGKHPFRGKRTFRFLCEDSTGGIIVGVASSDWTTSASYSGYYPGGGSFGCSARKWGAHPWSMKRRPDEFKNDLYESVAMFSGSHGDELSIEVDTENNLVKFFINGALQKNLKPEFETPGKSGEAVIILGSFCGAGNKLTVLSKPGKKERKKTGSCSPMKDS